MSLFSRCRSSEEQEPVERIIYALLDLDVLSALRLIGEAFADWSLPVHLADLLQVRMLSLVTLLGNRFADCSRDR